MDLMSTDAVEVIGIVAEFLAQMHRQQAENVATLYYGIFTFWSEFVIKLSKMLE